MKSRLYIIAICFLLMAVLPLISKKDVMDLIRPAAEEINSSDTEESEDKDDKDVFRILDSSTGKITVVPDSNFCIGALAYEMPPLYEDEALKAQTVALYSHFCYIRERNRKACDPELKGADLAADLSNGEIWYNEKQLKEKWGSGFDKYIKKLSGIVSSVQGEVIRDKNGAYADCCYFAFWIHSRDRSVAALVCDPFDRRFCGVELCLYGFALTLVHCKLRYAEHSLLYRRSYIDHSFCLLLAALDCRGDRCFSRFFCGNES